MARKRMISPTMWEDPGFNKLSVGARLLFVGMISHADDEGFIRADFGSLKRLVFGFDEAVTDLVFWFKEVQQFKNIHWYEYEGEQYAHFVKWDIYQKQQKDRIQASSYPSCSICVAGVKQVRKEVKLSKLSKDKISKDNTSRDFEEFWNIYPKKTEKKKTEEKWNRLTREDQEAILKDLPERIEHHDTWKRGYILNPLTYLNGERWNDEITKSETSIPKIEL